MGREQSVPCGLPSSGREGACGDIPDPYGVYVTGGAGDEREYKEDDACHLRDVTDGHEWCVAGG
ncbi:hypothetical protein NC86S3_1610002 [Escherichia coli]|nr:hypothetical protein NC86S1_270022 [Escherichia coli]SOQ97514.1 hypothetical protein NC86S2_330002 [Escherichia coli]SOR01583.1 hypothetical protein NC86S3_1610002 [Escherichia coli]